MTLVTWLGFNLVFPNNEMKRLQLERVGRIRMHIICTIFYIILYTASIVICHVSKNNDNFLNIKLLILLRGFRLP